MRIKLVFLPKEAISCLPPLGVATLTSFLRQNNLKVHQDDLSIKLFRRNLDGKNRVNLEVFHDENKIKNFIKGKEDQEIESEAYKLLKLTKWKNYEVVGFSLSEGYYSVATALVMAKLLKEMYDVKIVMGGYGGYFPEELQEYLLRERLVDAFFLPPQSLHLFYFCKALESGVAYENIPGIIFWKNGKIKKNEFTEDYVKPTYKRVFQRPKNFSEFIIPDFSGLPLDLYKPRISFLLNGSEVKYKMLVLPYLFIRGCPHKCAFCGFSLINYEAKDPARVAEELKFLSKKYRTKYFFFINCAINPTYKYAETLVDSFENINLDIVWSDCANFQTADKKLLEKLKDVGCAKLVFGLECASPRMLRFIEKPVTLPKVKEVLKDAYKIGIWSEINIICGFPYERRQDIEFTIRFLTKQKRYIQNITLTRFWLDGLMKVYPMKYGIRIRKPTSLVREDNMIPFDEVNGLRWEEKQRQIEEHFKLYSERVCKQLRRKKHRLPNFSEKELCYVHFISWWEGMKELAFTNVKEKSVEIRF